MENTINILSYIWDRLPIILMFINGYLIYRLFVVTRLTDTFVLRSIEKSRGKIVLLLFYILLTSALLSFFIPNAVTVLILIPILKKIDSDFSARAGTPLATPLTLSSIYGANIGGMGSLIGSPANLILIGALDLFKVPGREQISFLNWFIWSVPLVIVFIMIAFIIIFFNVPASARNNYIQVPKGAYYTNNTKITPEQKSGLMLFLFFLIFWILESILKKNITQFNIYEPIICICFFMIFVYLLIIKSTGVTKEPLLKFKEILTGFPRRGILFIGFLIIIISVVRLLNLDKKAADLILKVINNDLPVIMFFFFTVLSVIFLTEFLSNTVVSAAFFPVAYYVSIANNINPLILMIAVSIASTCAFMTPIATPCNALAFGEIKGTSLKKMLISGILLNISCAILMTLWLKYILPCVYY